MQYVNDDMDEVFRRAAEHYPLDTNSSNWDKVARALASPEDPKPEQPKKKNNRKQFLWLLVLLPLGLICNYYQNAGSDDQKTGAGAPGEQITQHADHDQAAGKRQNDLPVKESPASTGSSQAPPSANNKFENGIVQKSLKNNEVTRSTNEINPKEPTTINTRNQGQKEITGAGSEPHPLIRNQVANNRIAGVQKERGLANAAKQGQPDNMLTDQETLQGDRMNAGYPSYERASPQPYPLLAAGEHRLTPSMFSEEALKPNVLLSRELAPVPTAPKEKTKRFYAGIMGGVDATTIKFQKVEGMGYDYGLLLGYAFNTSWSVEAGLFMDHKTYYSDGKYYKATGIYMPPNSKITQVDGSCRMFEIPLAIRYNFTSPKKSNWFATAGLSSYLMEEEDYSYLYYYGTSGTYAWHDKYYNQGARHYFSIMHVSGGITRPLGKFADLRIEPYFKIPLTGLGSGKLPLLSTGVHVGITRKLF